MANSPCTRPTHVLGRTGASPLCQLKERSAQTYVQPAWLALIYTALGEKDQAFDWLQRAADDRSV